MARIEAPRGMGHGEGPLPQPTREFGGVVSSPTGVRKRIFAYSEGHRTLLLHLYADALSSSNCFLSHLGEGPRFGGNCRTAPFHCDC